MNVPEDRYDEIYRSFRWHVPEWFNIAEVCCGRWARETAHATAVLYEHEDGTRAAFTFCNSVPSASVHSVQLNTPCSLSVTASANAWACHGAAKTGPC